MDFGREKGVFPLVLIQVKSAAKRTVFGLKNKREKTFLPFKTQLFHIQVVRYAFRNIDILEHDEDDVPYQGCMAIDAGDRNRVKNILFEDIRVESIQEGKLFHINIRFNPKYDKQPGQSIDGVTFRNIIYNGVGENPSLIKGLDKERMVRNITFENVVVNGEKIKDLKGFITNEYIEGIKIK